MSKEAAAAIDREGWYLTSLTGGGEACEAEWMVFRLDRKMTEAVERAKSALLDLERTHGGWGNVTLRGFVSLVVVKGAEDEQILALFPDLDRDSWERLGGLEDDLVFVGKEFDPDSIPDGMDWRSECHGITVFSSSAYVVAIGKYSDSEVESADVAGLFPGAFPNG